MTRDEQRLEKAREAMHADRTPKNIAEFKRFSQRVAKARTAKRIEEEAAGLRAGRPAVGDAVAAPDTIEAKVGVHLEGGQ